MTNDFGVGLVGLGAIFSAYSILSIMICQHTKGSLFDLSPIAFYLLFFGIGFIVYGGILIKTEDNKIKDGIE